VNRTSTKPAEPARRPYRQRARAEAAEANAERILDAFARRLETSWFDEIRLEDVAREAEVSVQTIVRRFGGKDGLLTAVHERFGREVMTRRQVVPGQAAEALEALLEDYELSGDLVIRALAQEARHPALKRMTDKGRAGHRAWLAGVFEPQLARLPAGARQARLDALVAATDVYIWKLVRRDMERPVAELRALMWRFITAALNPETSA
jgi:AcrR family transcriptional regulator